MVLIMGARRGGGGGYHGPHHGCQQGEAIMVLSMGAHRRGGYDDPHHGGPQVGGWRYHSHHGSPQWSRGGGGLSSRAPLPLILRSFLFNCSNRTFFNRLA